MRWVPREARDDTEGQRRRGTQEARDDGRSQARGEGNDESAALPAHRPPSIKGISALTFGTSCDDIETTRLVLTPPAISKSFFRNIVTVPPSKCTYRSSHYRDEFIKAGMK
ncbi:hypothetical protein OIU84_008853 [Salix udensis]|uniref:Uncharacterized protein n=1 Tax=Salix udensis TaxID=889485 RepID=A0AAD6JQE5_9ROSI|nr:hypothetical protein OIU84_008853 [Salix udensis]